MVITYTLKGYCDTGGSREDECLEKLHYVLVAIQKRYDLHLEVVNEEVLKPKKDDL